MEGSIILCSICAKGRDDIDEPGEEIDSGKCQQCGREIPSFLGKRIHFAELRQPGEKWYGVPLSKGGAE